MPPVAPVLVNRNGQSPLWRKEDIDELGTVILPSEASHEDVDFADLHDAFGGFAEERDLRHAATKSIDL